MKKFLGIFLAAILCVMMAVAVNAADVYVNDGGTGDGTTAETPFGTMDEAINAIAAEGGTVHIVDTYTCADQYVEPEHAGDIVITGGKYVFAHGKYNRWYLSGAGSTTFENITFEYAAGSTSLYVAQFNELIMGEGIVMPETTGYVIGGYQKNDDYATLEEMVAGLGLATDKDSNVTIKSGSYHLVAGFNRGDDSARTSTTPFTGTSNITVDGGTMKTVYGGNINTNATAGAVNITINGGDILAAVRVAGEAQVIAQVLGDANVTINGGKLPSFVMNNVLGTVNVNYNGGELAQAAKNIDGSLEELKTEKTVSVINVADGLSVLPGVSMVFDTVNGKVATPDLPDIIKPTATTEAPATDAPAATTGAAEAPAEGGAPVALIIGIVAAVVVVAVIVVVVSKKKK